MSGSTRAIPAPSRRREPLKVNVFEMAKSGCSALLPMFPYLGPDAIVPATAGSWGEEGRRMGRFFHANSVDEVGICFGAGGNDRAPTGGVFTTGHLHPVGQGEFEPTPPAGSYTVITITQRHEEREQREAFVIKCDKCDHVIYRHRYAFVPQSPDGHELEVFQTVVECSLGAEEFNASQQLRTCEKCGYINKPFPLAEWGWKTYRMQAAAAEAARRTLHESVRRLDAADQVSA